MRSWNPLGFRRRERAVLQLDWRLALRLLRLPGIPGAYVFRISALAS